MPVKDIFFYWPLVLWTLGFLEFNLSVGLGLPRILTGASVWAAIILLVISFWRSRSEIGETLREFRKDWAEAPIAWKVCLGLVVVLLAVSFAESIYPPHNPQEYDALNYHMMIPRQHWLHGNLDWLRWSSADLWALPISYGMAPMWLMTSTLNKLPQMIASVWLFFLMVDLAKKLGAASFWAWTPALALFGTHGFVIQLGSAMMDGSILFCLLAAFHAYLRRQWMVSGVAASFYLCSKAFIPVQLACVVAGLGVWVVLTRRCRWDLDLAFSKRWLGVVLIGCAILSLRSAIVGLRHAGTPLYPFGTGTIGLFLQPDAPIDALTTAAKNHVAVVDSYGVGRSPWAWVKHLWVVAVPTQGVNNPYDYPRGLAWLLWLVFLPVGILHSARTRMRPLLLATALLFWFSWWMSSQQSRWLYPVLAFGWLGMIPILSHVSKRILYCALAASAAFSFLSQVRVVRPDLRRSFTEIQQEQEARLTWNAQGRLLTRESLYAEKPLSCHEMPDSMWIIYNTCL